MPIKLLDETTVAQIAAGEVVERPASVVKELVENALDAGASRVEVAVKGGGIDLIRVTDDGGGIAPDEVEIAFQRHATSKITGLQDLPSISSLGFRGEALPSIAAVARVEVLTAIGDGTAGVFVSLDGGNVMSKKSQARARGTTVTVHGLFQKVPARRKFLKSVPTEGGHIASTVSQYALAYPEVAFTLSVDTKTTLHTSGKGRLIDSILDVYGMEMAARMLPVDGEVEAWTADRGDTRVEVSGMVGSPELSRAGRGYLSFFVNRRWVSSRLLAYAVEEAYQGLLMTGKHPVCVLNINLPPAEIDVNIHPAKTEIKFRQESEVFRAVQRAVRQALTAQTPVPQIQEVATPYVGKSENIGFSPTLPRDSERAESPVPGTAPSLLASLPVLRVVGQVLNSYIVAEGPDGLYVIDQHAAHERVRFDKVRRERAVGKPEVQGLLESATFEVSPRQDQVLGECAEDLASFGFSLEPFGERAYLVRAVPAILAGDDWPRVLRELLETLSGEVRSRWEDEMVASIACHGAVLAGQVLSIDEMRTLVRDLEKTDIPHTCPHGRPTIIRLDKARLERGFGRG